MRLYLLAGQSNMAGRGTVAPEDQMPNAHVWMLDSTGTWLPAVDPVHFDKPKLVGVGPGRAFAIARWMQDSSVDIGLVPTAVGGTSIRAWDPGALEAATNTHPLDDAIRRIRIARVQGTFDGILRHQGESDANARGATEYEVRLRAVIARLRDATGNPNTVFLIGALGQFSGQPPNAYRAQVDSVHCAVATSTPRAAYVSSLGLQHRGDAVHFDAASAREFGRRYAVAFLQVRLGTVVGCRVR